MFASGELEGEHLKSKAFALSMLLVIFVSLVAGMHAVEVANANFVPASTIYVISPTNTTYNSKTVMLNCSVVFVVTENKLATYSLDGGANVTIINKQGLEPYVASEEFSGNIVLSDLTEGSHHLEIYSENVLPGYAEVYFFIETETSEPTPTEEPQLSEQDMTTGAIFAVTSIVAFLGSLFYFIKRRQSKSILASIH